MKLSYFIDPYREIMNNNGIKLKFPFHSAQELGIKNSTNIEFPLLNGWFPNGGEITNITQQIV